MKQTDKNFFDAIPKVGTQDFNNLSNEMFSGKPKQQTAVEWLIEELTKNTWYDESNYPQVNIGVIDFEQAKELEKEQLINFHIETMKIGLIKEGEKKWLESYKPKITKIAEEYYNKTFKNQ